MKVARIDYHIPRIKYDHVILEGYGKRNRMVQIVRGLTHVRENSPIKGNSNRRHGKRLISNPNFINFLDKCDNELNDRLELSGAWH